MTLEYYYTVDTNYSSLLVYHGSKINPNLEVHLKSMNTVFLSLGKTKIDTHDFYTT
jgi:hypothetical protein